VQFSDFMNIPFLEIFAESIFSASAGVIRGEPRFLQHFAHSAAKQSSRNGAVAGFRCKRPFLRAFKTVFKSSQFIFQLSIWKNYTAYLQAGAARRLLNLPRAAGMQGTGLRLLCRILRLPSR